ncbi:MAG: 50S ribosomal protein L25/general stress protein Ctc [Bacillota bacterium]|uniref:50S ribosomal protein L25/general stress protein Ctc n=1 Tax=Desulforudis sp. DRI-14 TaxID=3459793 RepID=UPI0034995225
MATANLEVTPRDKRGKNQLNTLREQGKVPGVVYGKSVGNLPVEMDGREIEDIVKHHGSAALVELKVKTGSKPKKYHAIIKEVQYHPFKRQIQHIDLQQISLKEEVHTHVPLHFVGAAPGVKQGGVLAYHLRQIEVACLPMKIPEHIEVDISGLDIGDNIHVSELAVPEGVKVLTEGGSVVVAVTALRREAEAVAEPAAEAAPTAAENVEAEAKPE